MNSVISAHFILQVTYNPQGSLILTASSDKTARLWDPTSGNCIQVNLDMATLLLLSYCQTHTHTQCLEGHSDEIFSCAFNYTGDIIITGIYMYTTVLTF